MSDYNELYKKLKQTEGYKIYYREAVVVHLVATVLATFLFVATIFTGYKKIGDIIIMGVLCVEFLFLYISTRALFNDIFREKPVNIYIGTVSDILLRDSMGREVDNVFFHETAQLYYRIGTDEGEFEGTAPTRSEKKSSRNPQNIVVGEQCYGFTTYNGERFVVK